MIPATRELRPFGIDGLYDLCGLLNCCAVRGDTFDIPLNNIFKSELAIAIQLIFLRNTYRIRKVRSFTASVIKSLDFGAVSDKCNYQN